MRAINSYLTLTNVTFEDNMVVAPAYEVEGHPTSGGLAVWYDVSHLVHTIKLSHCTFHNNTLRTANEPSVSKTTTAAGGAMNLLVWKTGTPSTGEELQRVVAHVENSSFVNNNIVPEKVPEQLLATRGLAYGGAVSFRTFNNAQGNSLRFDNCTFKNNTALHGGAVAIAFYSEGGHNSVEFSKNCVLESNKATGRHQCPLTGDDLFGFGGAIALEVHSTGCGNSLQVDNSHFQKNGAFKGGAINVALYDREQCTNVLIIGSNFTNNQAQIGSAMNWWAVQRWIRLSGIISLERETSTTGGPLLIADSTFKYNRAYFRGAVAIGSLQVLFAGRIIFQGNVNSALLLQSAVIWHMTGANVLFADNWGEAGGGIFMEESHFVVNDNSSASFSNNTALSKGGAMFISNGPM